MKMDTTVWCGWTTQPYRKCIRKNEYCSSGAGGELSYFRTWLNIWMWRGPISVGLWIFRRPKLDWALALGLELVRIGLGCENQLGPSPFQTQAQSNLGFLNSWALHLRLKSSIRFYGYNSTMVESSTRTRRQCPFSWTQTVTFTQAQFIYYICFNVNFRI